MRTTDKTDAPQIESEEAGLFDSHCDGIEALAEIFRLKVRLNADDPNFSLFPEGITMPDPVCEVFSLRRRVE